jgi:hypothetical protein
MEISDLIKIISPLALVGLVWTIASFFLKRKYEKSDKRKEQKIKILTDYLLKLNELRGVLHQAQDEISKGNQVLRKTLQTYRNQFDGIFNEETENNKDLMSKRFLEMEEEKRLDFLKESKIYFQDQKGINTNIKNNLSGIAIEIEAKGLDLKKDALINIHATTEIFKGQVNLIDLLYQFTDKSVIIDEDTSDVMKTYLNFLRLITKECYDLEFNVIVELRKVSIN